MGAVDKEPALSLVSFYFISWGSLKTYMSPHPSRVFKLSDMHRFSIGRVFTELYL